MSTHHPFVEPNCGMLELPDELLLLVLQLLDPRDILQVRQCCSRLYVVTHDLTLWMAVASHLSQWLPLPSLDRIRTFKLPELVHSCVRAVHVARQWLVPRESTPRKINIILDNRHIADYLWFCDNRFVVALYSQVCAVLLWDLDGLQVHGSSGQHIWGRVVGKWTPPELRTIALTKCKARFCERTREIFISFFSVPAASQDGHLLTLLSIPTSGNPAQERQFRQSDIALKEVISESHTTSLNPDISCIAHCSPRSESVTLTNWKSGHSTTLSAPGRIPDREDAWENTFCIEVFEPYVIVVKQNLLILYLIPADLDNRTSSAISAHVELVHVLGDNTHTASLRFQDTTRETIEFILAVSNSFKSVSYYHLRLPRHPSSAFSLRLSLLYSDHTLAERGVFIRSGVSLGSRGMRAVWIEKARQNLDRTVVVLNTDRGRLNFGPGADVVSQSNVFKMSSADFNEDPTFVACDEVTGRIVLATRGGELWVLDCWRKPIVEQKPLARFQNHEGI